MGEERWVCCFDDDEDEDWIGNLRYRVRSMRIVRERQRSMYDVKIVMGRTLGMPPWGSSKDILWFRRLINAFN